MKVFRVSAITALVAAALYGVVNLYLWYGGDAIDRANVQTTWLLRSHLIVDRSAQVRAWLDQNHGEAPGSEVMNVFVSWSIAHPRSAEAIAQTMSAQEMASLMPRVAWAALDSGQNFKLKEVLGTSRSVFYIGAMKELLVLEKEVNARSVSSNSAFEKGRRKSAAPLN